MQRLGNPFPIFLDQHGDLLSGGSVYIGTANADPETSPITVYWDFAGTLPAVQPIRTIGGVLVNNGTPAIVYIAADDYSCRVKDSAGNQVSYTKTVTDIGGLGVSYQPLDSDLTAIAALTTTSFGRSLLTLANQAALQAAVGITASLPLTGGTVSGNIVRSGGGGHLYHNESVYTSGRVITTANGAADPTTTAGDIWLELEP